MTSSGAERSVEIERKYDADSETPLPDWSRLAPVARVGDAEPRSLDAVYLDTPARDLARAATALRRRTGGPDEGWHIKRATSEGKLELRWPLGEVGDAAPVMAVDVPADVVRALSELIGQDVSPRLQPVARIRNARTAYALLDAADGLVAEFVDDRVTATDLGRDRVTSWREWEMELGPAGPAGPARTAFFAVVDDLVREAGGAVSPSGSKLGRALGV